MNRAEIIKKIKPLVRNKYFIATAAFIIWLSVFDENNLIKRNKLSSRIEKQQKEQQHFNLEIEQNTRKMKELRSSKENLEKFAREEYLMKKKDEVIFVIKEE